MLPTSVEPRLWSRYRVTLSFYAFCILSTTCSFTSAQLVKGQFFTNGLAISDSPAPGSQANAGSSLNVAIDLSGDGKLPDQNAFLPNSTASTAYQSLNLYLVSSETNLNLTVSEGPQLLEQEPGSTVKHLNWPIPACVPSGNYNLTFYELSRFDGGSYYSITPIPIVITSKSSSPCPNAVAPFPQPQNSSPPPQQPWLSSNSNTTPLAPSSTFTSGSGADTGASRPSGSGSGPDSGPITITLSPSPTTVMLTSTVTVSTVVNGVATMFTTATTIASVSTVLPSGGTLLPVNAAAPNPLCCFPVIITWAYIVTLHIL